MSINASLKCYIYDRYILVCIQVYYDRSVEHNKEAAIYKNEHLKIHIDTALLIFANVENFKGKAFFSYSHYRFLFFK